MAYIQQSGTGTTARVPKGKFEAETSSKELLKENPDRIELIISNPGTKDVWLSLGTTAVAEEGIYLKSGGGSWVSNGYSGPVFCITGSEKSKLAYAEI